MIGSKVIANESDCRKWNDRICYRCNGRVNEINRFWCNFMVFLVWE